MLTTALEQLRSIRARTLTMVQGLSQAQMDYSPAPETWSIGEVVDHLISSERITRGDIAALVELAKAGRKPVLYRSSAEFNVTTFFIPKCTLPFLEAPFNFLNMFVPDGVREFFVRYALIPARAADAASPRPGRSAADLQREHRASLEETQALLAANPGLDYDEMIHQHPLLGTQNVPHLLYVLGLHEQRHQAQISELLANPQFPISSQDVEDPRLSPSLAGGSHATGERA
jgi:hypothetical protein